MFSSLRFLTMAVFLASAPNAWGQQPAPVAVPPQLASDAKDKSDSLYQVFSLRNVAAADMQTTLRDLYGGDGSMVVSAQPQTNQLIVVGSPAAIEKVEALLSVLDQTAAEPVVQMLSNESRASISKNLAQTVAEAAQVDLAFDEELGVMMIRSDSSERVKRFTDVLDRLNSQIQTESKVVEREVLIRVSWLMPRESAGDTSSIRSDDSLKLAMDKLSSMGYTDLVVTGQLMTRCSVGSSSANNSPKFEAEGHTPEGFDLGVRGYFVVHRGSGDDERIDVNMSVNVAQATKTENRNDCLLSVVLKMKQDKPIILGSAPVAGAQSFFVVQFTSAD